MAVTPDDKMRRVWALADDRRRALYEYVVGRKTAVGRDQAAGAVGVPRSVAAYHLDRLAEHGLLEVEFRRPAGRGGPGAGRPAKLYRRSAAEIAVNLPPRDYRLAAELLATAVASVKSGAAKRNLLAAARTLGSRIGTETGGRRGMRALRRLLADRGYEPFNDGDVVRLRNCPFRSLVDEHRDVVCTMNHALLEGMCHAATDGHARATLDQRPDACCVAISRDR